MSKPLLSVILVNYNYCQYITKALEQILLQDYHPYEVIIMDDASTDNSIEVITPYLKKHPNLKLLKHKKNRGHITLINESFNYANGDYIYWAASDDHIDPDFFSKSMNLLIKHPRIGLSCCNARNIDKDTLKEDITPIDNLDKVFYVLPPYKALNFLKTTSVSIVGGTPIIKKNLGVHLGRHNKDLTCKHDWYLNIKVALTNGMIYIPQSLVNIRRHPNSYSQQILSQKTKTKKLKLKLLETINKEPPEIKKAIKNSASLIHMSMINFLLVHPKYWHYLPSLLRKKIRNIQKKLPSYLMKHLKSFTKLK